MDNTVIGAFMTGIHSDSPSYINALLSTNKFDEEIEKNLGATINQITTGAFKEMEFTISANSDEKKKIGDFFESIDNLITLHQSKCGEIDIKTTRTWEQRKVTEVGKVFIGLVTTMTKNYTDIGTLLIRNSDIKDNHFEFDSNPIYLDESFAESNDNRRMHIGDVVTVHTGDVGTSAVITENEDGS